MATNSSSLLIPDSRWRTSSPSRKRKCRLRKQSRLTLLQLPPSLRSSKRVSRRRMKKPVLNRSLKRLKSPRRKKRKRNKRREIDRRARQSGHRVPVHASQFRFFDCRSRCRALWRTAKQSALSGAYCEDQRRFGAGSSGKTRNLHEPEWHGGARVGREIRVAAGAGSHRYL